MRLGTVRVFETLLLQSAHGVTFAGVIYINRIPPHMVCTQCYYWSAVAGCRNLSAPEMLKLLRVQKPQKLRHLLSQHGKIARIYLAPEGQPVSLAGCVQEFLSTAPSNP